MNGSKTAQKELPMINMADVRRRDCRKNYYMPKGTGKTARILAIAEYFGASVICASEERRRHIQSVCKQWAYRIPAVYTAADIVAGRLIGTPRRKYTVDDAGDVLQSLLDGLTGGKADIIAMASRTEERNEEFD